MAPLPLAGEGLGERGRPCPRMPAEQTYGSGYVLSQGFDEFVCNDDPPLPQPIPRPRAASRAGCGRRGAVLRENPAFAPHKGGRGDHRCERISIEQGTSTNAFIRTLLKNA
jgi:hypothetical protein